MRVNRYVWNEVSEDVRERVLRRAGADIARQTQAAAAIVEDVRTRGDEAVLEYTERFDGVRLQLGRVRVSEDEIAAAPAQLTDSLRKALDYAAGNIRRFHEAQRPEPMWLMEVDRGILAGEKVTPISDVALYVPRGKGSFPSVLLMLGTPAAVAGVPRVVVLTPPNSEGGVDPAILYAASLLGIEEIYKVGGAQAIAAAAFGTRTIPRCAKVIGPGNPYVTAAKRLLSGEIDTGVPAGPSEAVILADEHADARTVTLDLCIEAEHGPDSASLLVTHSLQLAEAVERELPGVVAGIADEARRRFVETVLGQYGGIVVTQSLADSVAFVNEYAPEHLEVQAKDPWAILPDIDHAGEILLGENTPITLCNFLLGPNAVLPTGRRARTVSAVSLNDFLKRSSIGYATAEGLARVREHAAVFADAEGFEAHARAVRERGRPNTGEEGSL